MKAILLAAGIGSRLHPLTQNKPKTLVKVNGVPILKRAVEALLKNGIRDIVICCGCGADQLVEYCSRTFPGTPISFVHNERYAATNNMYSLFLARGHLTDDTLILNGDVVFEEGIAAALRDKPGNWVAVEKGRYREESMKVTVREGHIRSISKKIPPEAAYGCSLDIYKFGKESLPALVREMEKIIVGGKDLNQWTEVMLDRLFQTDELAARPLDINPARWYEIDDLADLSLAEIAMNPAVERLAEKKLFIVDGDGTLFIGSRPLPGAREFLDRLAALGKKYYLMTNNSSKSRRRHYEELKALGFPLAEDQVLVSTEAAALFLKESGMKRIFWAANREVAASLEAEGFVYDDQRPQALLLTYDTEITYAKLQRLVELVRAGIPYFATHPDQVCPAPQGALPDIGCFIDLVRSVTGASPARIFGKPEPAFLEPVLKRHGIPASETVVVGDRLYTDIRLARNAGAVPVLVLSGETTRILYEESELQADVVAPGLEVLLPFFTPDARPGAVSGTRAKA